MLKAHLVIRHPLELSNASHSAMCLPSEQLRLHSKFNQFQLGHFLSPHKLH